jgi:DNA-binding beta-propeller fold protein YncE
MPDARLTRWLRTAALPAALVAAVLLGLPVAATAAPWTAPHVERIIGAPSRPGVGAWGLAYNPVTDEMIVGDYVSDQVRRYTRSGTWIADFSNPRGYIPGVVSAIAVDPRDGSTYVAVTGDGSDSLDVRKYDVNGNYIYGADLIGNITWLAVDDEGNVWAPGAFTGPGIHEYRFNDATKTATELRSVGTKGSDPGELNRLTGIAVDGGGNVYVCDVGNGNVHVFGPDGAWRFDIGNKSLFPGDLRGIVVNDAAQRLYVANSQVGTIEMFDLDGNHLATFGGLGSGDGEFLDGPRQLAITPDDHVWGADYASLRVEELTATGAFVNAFPDPAQPPDPAGLGSPRGVAVDPVTGDVLVADNWNQRIQRFAPDGTLLQVFGERGSFPPSGMNYPRSVAVDPATRNVWVGNYEGSPDLMVFTPDFHVVRHIVTPRFVNDVEISGDKAYVLVRRDGNKDGYVRVYDTATGALLRTCCTGLGWLRGVGVDPNNGNLWLTADSGTHVYVVNSNGSLLQTLNVDSRPWGVTIVGDVVYVADTGAHRVIAFDRTSYARLGQFGTRGAKPGQMIGPSGIDHDAAGNLYVVEDDAARVQRFGWSAPPSPETVKPTIAWTVPGPAVPIVFTGTAADAGKVMVVDVQVQDPLTGKYWNARTATWGTVLWNRAVVWGPLTSPSWRYTFVPAVAGHTYVVKARAIDASGNVSKVLSGSFTRG